MKVLIVPMNVYDERDYYWLKMFAARNVDVIFVSDNEDDVYFVENVLKCKHQNNRFDGEIHSDAAVFEICRKLGVVTKNIAYVGQTIIDIRPLGFVGIPLCTNDADYTIKRKILENTPNSYGDIIHSFETCENIMPNKHFSSTFEWIFVNQFGIPTIEDMNKMIVIESLESQV